MNAKLTTMNLKHRRDWRYDRNPVGMVRRANTRDEAEAGYTVVNYMSFTSNRIDLPHGE